MAHNPLLLLPGELGEHREGDHLGGGLLGDRQVTRTEAQRLVGLREVKRDRVVDARSDAGGGQILLESVTVRDPHHVEMVDRSRPRRLIGKGEGSVGTGEELVVAACPLPALLVPHRQITKLHLQDTRLDGIEPAIVPLNVVVVLP